jgi:hypothetical protein
MDTSVDWSHVRLRGSGFADASLAPGGMDSTIRVTEAAPVIASGASQVAAATMAIFRSVPDKFSGARYRGLGTAAEGRKTPPAPLSDQAQAAMPRSLLSTADALRCAAAPEATVVGAAETATERVCGTGCTVSVVVSLA